VTQTSRTMKYWPDIASNSAEQPQRPRFQPADSEHQGTESVRRGWWCFPPRQLSNRCNGTWTPMRRTPIRCSGTSEFQAINDSTTLTSTTSAPEVAVWTWVAITCSAHPRARRSPLASALPTSTPLTMTAAWPRNYNSPSSNFSKRYSAGLAYQSRIRTRSRSDIALSGWYGVEGQSDRIPTTTTRRSRLRVLTSPRYLTANMSTNFHSEAASVRNRQQGCQLSPRRMAVQPILRPAPAFPQHHRTGRPPNTGNTGYLRANLGKPEYCQSHFGGPGLIRGFRRPAVYIRQPGPIRASQFGLLEHGHLHIPRLPIMEKRRRVRAESFISPTLDHGTPNGNALIQTSARVTGTQNSPRSLQLGAKVIFDPGVR